MVSRATRASLNEFQRSRHGPELGYDEWIKEIATDARSFNGYLGAHVIQFDTCPNLEAWMQSEIRKDWVEPVKPLIREPESTKVLAVPMSPLCRAPAPGFLASWP